MSTATVVGGGPNGLAAAVALAREGVRVTVLEAAGEAGGGARSGESLVPGLLHDHCAAFHPMAAGSPFLNGLGLDRYGLSWRWAEIDCAHPLDGGDAGLLYRSVEDTAAGLGGDGARWRLVFGRPAATYDTLACDIMRPLLRAPSHPLALARFGLPTLLPGSSFARIFGTEKARALFGGVAAHAFRPLHYPLTSAIGAGIITAGHRWGWPVAAGGSGSITAALAALLADLGGKIETGVLVRAAAQLPPADVTLFDLAPDAVASLLDDQLPPRVARALRRFRRAPGAFKVDFAVEGGVPWANPDVGRAGTVHLGGDFAEIAATEREINAGRLPERPFVLVGQQYLADPQRSADGVHPVYSYAHVPHGYAGDATEAIIGQIERFAPGFRERIVARASYGPASFAAGNPNFAGGDIITGAKDTRQLVFGPRITMSPYHLGVPGMYLCSAATPPGPGLHGMCGANAAADALRYLRRQGKALRGRDAMRGQVARAELPGTHALPPAERLREARHFGISQPLGDLGDRHPPGDQELLGELLPDLVQQPAERDVLGGKPAAQGALAHVQRRGDLFGVRRRGGPGEQVVPDLSRHPRPRVPAGQQLPALLAGDRGGVLVGLRQRQVEYLGGDAHRALRRAEYRRYAEDLGVPPRARRRRGERIADFPDVDRRCEQLVLNGLDRRAVPLDHEPPQRQRDIRRVQNQVELRTAVPRHDPGERERQVQVPQADIDRAAPGGAADHRESPDAVGGQVIADARLQPQPRRVAQLAQQVLDHRELLTGADRGSGVTQMLLRQPGGLQAYPRGQAAIGAQPDQQLHAHRRPFDVPAHHVRPPHPREKANRPAPNVITVRPAGNHAGWLGASLPRCRGPPPIARAYGTTVPIILRTAVRVGHIHAMGFNRVTWTPGHDRKPIGASRFRQLAKLRRQREARARETAAGRALQGSLLSLAALLGSEVRDPDGRTVGRLSDVVVHWTARGAYPPVTAIIVKTGKLEVVIGARWLEVASPSAVRLRSSRAYAGAAERHRDDVALARDVLDRQVIDARGVQLLRPADLYLAAVENRIELVGIEVGIGALARRLGPRRLRGRVRPARVIDWGSVSAFAPSRAEGDEHRGRRSEIAGAAGVGLELDRGAAEVRRLRPTEVRAALDEALATRTGEQS